jgi:hypothetical protein
MDHPPQSDTLLALSLPMACDKDKIPQSRQPYHSYVHNLSKRWRHLQHLDDFMDKHETQSGSISDTHVTIIDICDGCRQRDSGFTSVVNLSAFLNNTPPKQCSRLFLVENISRDFIEYLGSHFDIDPAMFSSHIYGFDWFGRCSSATTVPSLPSGLRTQEFAHFRYLEARPVRAGINDPVNVDGLPCFNCNILRKFSVMTLSSTRYPIGFARRHVTVWMKNHGESYWTGNYVPRI